MNYRCDNIEKLYYKWGYKKYAIGMSQATLEFKNGDIIGVVGTSRSGKSTLIDMLSGSLKPTTGELNYDAKKISRVYKESGVRLNKSLTVYDNMVYFGKKQKMSELEVENRMAQLRDIFSLNKYINTKASELSICNKVKSELAMLLLKTPRILFIDDAFTFLNNADKNEVLKCLKRLNKQERTIIIIAATHVSDVDKIINRIILVSKSEVIYDDSFELFKSKYCTKKIFEVYLNKNVSIARLDGVDILDNSEYYYKLRFNNSIGVFTDVIKLFDMNTIIDMKLNDEDISDIADEIKKGDKND